MSLHIVNNDIYPYQGSIDDFLQDRDIYASTAGVGNPAYTDFGRILDRILSTQGPSEVSVLVTDLIYSPADTKDLSIDKLLNEERSLVASTFKKHEGKSVLVHQCVGDFDGKYYTYRGGAVDYRGERQARLQHDDFPRHVVAATAHQDVKHRARVDGYRAQQQARHSECQHRHRESGEREHIAQRGGSSGSHGTMR